MRNRAFGRGRGLTAPPRCGTVRANAPAAAPPGRSGQERGRKRMRVEIPRPLRRLQAALDAPLYLVGGAVRNALLGLPPGDLDAAGPLPPEAAASRCALAGLAAAPVDRALGTLLIRVDGAAVEYTPFRAERYAAGGAHRPQAVRLGATLEQDAARRDFTVNALYAGCADGRVADPLGGLADLRAGVLRQAGPATMRSDALRVLRLVRIAGELGFSIEAETFAAAAAHAGGLADIAPQRRQAELVRILLCDARYPRPGSAGAQHVAAALDRLAALGAWAHLLPELAGHPQAARAFAACAAAPPELALRLAALLHLLPEDGVKRRLAALCLPRAAAEGAATLVARQGVIHQAADEAALRRRFARWGRDGTARQLALCGALASAGGGAAAEAACARARALFERMCGDGTPFSLGELRVDGAQLMHALGIGPGARIGALLDALWDHCALRPADNAPERLLALARRLHGQWPRR